MNHAPSDAFDPKLFEISGEDNHVNKPTDCVMNKLVPGLFQSRCTCNSSHNVHEHRVDIVVADGPVLAGKQLLHFMKASSVLGV